MEPYLEKFYFIESMVVLPKYLHSGLREHLRSMINQKYSNDVNMPHDSTLYPSEHFLNKGLKYQNKGYVYNIQIDSILNDKINPSGQVILEVRFKADLYQPKVGHIFESEINYGRNHRWIQVGPLFIYLVDDAQKHQTTQLKVTVRIVSIKSDNSLCCGRIVE